MTVDGFKMLPGGLHVSAVPMKNDPVHFSALGGALSAAVEYEAKTHSANFDRRAFGKVIEAVKSDDIQAWFLLAAWDMCQPKVVGAAVEFPTVLTHWDGQEFRHSHAIYQEDTVLPFGMMRNLARERPRSKKFPDDIGLAEFFENERIRLRIQEGQELPPIGRAGEYSPRNTAIIEIMKRSGARLGTEATGSIFELKGALPDNLALFRQPVDVEELFYSPHDPTPLPHVFVAQWASPDNKQRIAASFTKGLSTFTGETIILTQITSNGNLPKEWILKHVLASLLAAGQEEAINRRWGAPKNEPPTSPLIAIHEGRAEALNGLIASNKVELFVPRKPADPLFGHSPPTMRIHALGEPQIIAALEEQLPRRILGVHPMLATDQVFEGQNSSIRPFSTSSEKDEAVLRLVI